MTNTVNGTDNAGAAGEKEPTLSSIAKEILVNCEGDHDRARPLIMDRYAEAGLQVEAFRLAANHMMAVVKTNQRSVIWKLDPDNEEKVAKAREQNFRAMTPTMGFKRSNLTDMDAIILGMKLPFTNSTLESLTWGELAIASDRMGTAATTILERKKFADTLLARRGDARDDTPIAKTLGLRTVTRIFKEMRPVVIDAETVTPPPLLAPEATRSSS